jgi:hypothetical protein
MWDSLINLQKQLEEMFDASLERYQEEHLDRFNQPGWVNITWRSERFRRVHIDVVDARESKKLWMMHVCIFPNLKSGAPIYGFDVISGPTKVTGAFHDFSPVNLNDPALKYFSDVASKYTWSKPRELPDWARAIFSSSMIAAGNIQTEKEIGEVVSLVLSNTNWYLNTMKVTDDMPSSYAHNRYAHFQKQNPHTPRTMKALGLNEEDVDYFVSKCLFPEVV